MTRQVVPWKRQLAATRSNGAQAGNYRVGMMVNGLGAVATSLTALAVLFAEFVEGARIATLLIAGMIA